MKYIEYYNARNTILFYTHTYASIFIAITNYKILIISYANTIIYIHNIIDTKITC